MNWFILVKSIHHSTDWFSLNPFLRVELLQSPPVHLEISAGANNLSTDANIIENTAKFIICNENVVNIFNNQENSLVTNFRATKFEKDIREKLVHFEIESQSLLQVVEEKPTKMKRRYRKHQRYHVNFNKPWYAIMGSSYTTPSKTGTLIIIIWSLVSRGKSISCADIMSTLKFSTRGLFHMKRVQWKSSELN